MTITLENGKQFIIKANDNSDKNVYVQKALLNGAAYGKNYIRHSDIINGGVLEFNMGDKPETSRGTTVADKPFSLSVK